MRRVVLLLCVYCADCRMWRKGVVHYAINKKDYDIHSQDEIITTLSQLQSEICVKFFYTPLNYTADDNQRLLYISNPDKRKNCPPSIYNFTGDVVEMPIGYKCVNRKDIARIVVDMLRASVERTVSSINSYDLLKKFHDRKLKKNHNWAYFRRMYYFTKSSESHEELIFGKRRYFTYKDEDPSRPALLAPPDRNFINAHYHAECGALAQRSVPTRRQGAEGPEQFQLSADNLKFYSDKMWPLGIVMFGVEDKLRATTDYNVLKYAMTTIELSSCVVFQEIRRSDGVLLPKNYLWFSADGEEVPRLGFGPGRQIISLESMVRGAPGHHAHALVNLMRALGVPMMSNRFDRDNYVTINWRYIQRGKEHHFERAPSAAWIQLAYDFDSVTHAPANYMCSRCELGDQSLKPLQDHLWQRTMSMGHRTQLSKADNKILDLLYGHQCRNRLVSDNLANMRKKM